MKRKHTHWAVALGVAAALLAPQLGSDAQGRGAAKMRDYPVTPVPFTDVHFTDEFWLPKIETNRKVTIPFAFQKCEETGRVANLDRAAKVLRGDNTDRKLPGYPFDDTDIYKVIEGAAYAMSVQPDPQLDAYVDGLIAKIGAAQEPDGYLYPARTINPERPHPWAGAARWQLEEVDSHELYELGHLYEAAVAHFQATGKRSLLNIALNTADLLDRTFGPGKRAIWPGHQITEMGLVKLYRVTGEARYLNLAKFLLDSRGPNSGPGSGREYNQSHRKIVDQTEAVGHAVRAAYMYSGIADVAALTGDAAYIKAIDTIWENVVGRKLYITGGIGATGAGEAFGRNYELPNMSAYCETCAAVGNDYWNQRLFLLHGDAKYVDVMERTLYNGLISGVSLDGKAFFYPNPLESVGQHQRSPWFGVACCPGNITRFLASVPGYAYARQADTIFVNLYVAGTAQVKLASGRKVNLVQQTRYPWNGDIRLVVNPERTGRLSVAMRIPGWARGEAAPGDLYHFADRGEAEPVLRVNDRPVPIKIDKGYVKLDRTWKRGDVVQLTLPMPIRRIAANEAVIADRGRIALQRGPLVYCAEGPDNPGGRVRNLMLTDSQELATHFEPALLRGVQVIEGRAQSIKRDGKGGVSRTEQPFRAIPYYAWANRGRSEMQVWLANTEASAQPLPFPSLASTSTVRTSGGQNARALNDQAAPLSSGDESNPFFHWWPKKGTTEWVEYTFAASQSVSECDVYWFDDTGRGECRVPASWRVLYRDGAEWKPVATSDAYATALDAYNRIAFKPVKTIALRLEVTLKPNWSAGIQEWRVK